MTVCKDFRCEKEDVCLYFWASDEDCGEYNHSCGCRICHFCRIRQTCSKYKADLILKKVKSRQNKSAKK